MSEAKPERTAKPGDLLLQWWTPGAIAADRRTTGRHMKAGWVIMCAKRVLYAALAAVNFLLSLPAQVLNPRRDAIHDSTSARSYLIWRPILKKRRAAPGASPLRQLAGAKAGERGCVINREEIHWVLPNGRSVRPGRVLPLSASRPSKPSLAARFR